VIQNNLAFLLALEGDSHEEALKLIQAAIDEAGPHPALLDTRGVVHLTGGNADLAIKDLLQVVAQAPKLMPWIPAMCEAIAAALSVRPNQVNVKAKTAEKMGPVGEARAIEARAVCLLLKP